MTEEDLRKLIRDDHEGFDHILGHMQAYNANINGSNAYLFQHRIELEALMDQEGMSSLWLSVSMADNHWADLHHALDPLSVEREFESEKERVKFKQKMARENPHLVDGFFFHRCQVMFDTFFGPQGFEAKWNWLHGELQG